MTRPAASILIVDAVEADRDRLARGLLREGYRAVKAGTDEDVMELIAGEAIDLVLIGIHDGGASEMALLQTIRARFSHAELGIIVISPQRDTELIPHSLDLGADDYVKRPVDLSILLRRMRSRLEASGIDWRPASSAGGMLTEPELHAWRIQKRRAAVAPDEEATGPLDQPKESPAGEDEGDAPPVTENRKHDSLVGMTVARRYLLDELIGVGGFGAVYRARHIDQKTLYAIKILDRQLSTAGPSLERFRREGIAASRLQHDNAVRIHDFGVEQDGLAYLVMELLYGEDLAQRMQRRKTMQASEVATFLGPVCSALSHAHGREVIHRDLKPANFFFHQTKELDEEVVKVLDFGVARLLDTDDDGRLTASGSVVGTPTFMSPEALMAQGCSGATDVYSLGIVLYMVLTGTHPFIKGRVPPNPIDLATDHLFTPPPPLVDRRPGLDPEIDRIVRWTLAKEAEDRPTPEALAEAFEAAVNAAAAGSIGSPA